MAARALAVLEADLRSYRRTWRGSAISSFLTPLLFAVGFGVGVGSFVDGSGRLGSPYLTFIAPGLVVSTALQVAFFEASWPAFSKFVWIRTYSGMAATPLRPGDIVGGEVLFIAFRVLLTGIVFSAVLACFGALPSLWSPLVPLVAVLLAVAVAAPVLALAASVGTDASFMFLQRLLVLPMTLFAGVFFPLHVLPAVLRWLAYLTPLWHAVELSRAAASGGAPPWPAAGHLAYLAAWAAVGWWLAVRAFGRRLYR